MPCSSGYALSVELHRDALEGVHDRDGQLESCMMTGWSGPSISPEAIAEKQAVADLAGGSGDGDTHGTGHLGLSKAGP
jgi:hypothetical protein